VLREVVYWARDHQSLAPLRQALASGPDTDVAGLDGLSAGDRDLLRGLVASSADRLATAAAWYSRVLLAEPGRPLALQELATLAPYLRIAPARCDSLLSASLASAAASVYQLASLAGADPTSIVGDLRAAALARLRASPPRPQLAAAIAWEALLDHLREPGLTADRLGGWLDEFHAEFPAGCNIMLDDLLGAALDWLDPAALQILLAAREAWLTPGSLARCRSRLAAADDREYAAFRAALAPARGPDAPPPWYGLAGAVDWHPDADETERWARRLSEEALSRSWTAAALVLRSRGDPAGADSLRALFARECPLAFALHRLTELEMSDPAAAAALLDTLEQEAGPAPLLKHRLYLAEAGGDTLTLARIRREYPPGVTASLLAYAALGAERHDDLARLRTLHALARELTPDRSVLTVRLAALAIQRGAWDLARELVAELSARAPRPGALFSVRVDETMHGGRPDETRAIIADYLVDPDVDVAQLSLIPLYAEGAGWPDLADRALASLEAAAPGAPRTALVRGQLLARRGSLDAARPILSALLAAWPGSAEVKSALVDAGDLVDTYRDPRPERDSRRLGGLEFDYAATDWSVDRRAAADEFPGQDQLVLGDRHTYLLVSRESLVYRHRQTVQLLTESAVQQYATVRIAFRSDEDMPRLICARTIAPDGQVRDVDPSDVLVTAHRDDETDVSDARDLVIPFSGLKPGAVVDVCVETAPGAFLSLGHAWTHRFGNFVPQREEILEILVAPGVAHDVYAAPAPRAAERDDVAGTTVYRWRLTDTAPAVYEELAPITAALPHWVGCTTLGGWDELARQYGRTFWPQTAVDDSLRALAATLCAAASSDEERLEILFAHVQTEVANIGIELGAGRFVPTSAREVLRCGYGDCKDKVATFTALLAAVGIDGLPVLVGTRPSQEVADDFPCATCFDHLIAYVPDVAGGVFCDPTLGRGCLRYLPDVIAGQRALVIRANGSGKLVQLPERDNRLPEIETEVDLRPQPDGALRAEVVTTVRHASAHLTEQYFDYPDTNAVNEIVAMLVGDKVAEDLVLRRWQHEPLPCGAYRVTAVLQDTSWADPEAHDASLVWFGAADSAIDLPDVETRTLPLEIDAPQNYRLVLRAHEVAGWRLSTRHAPIQVEAPGLRGVVTVDRRVDGEAHWLEIVRTLHFTQRQFAAADYREVRNQYLSFRLACFQPIHYHRLGDEARLAQLRAYCAEHPDDLAFSFRAALQVLGGDLGGEGDDGRERRRLARELLAPALASPDVSGIPFVWATAIATADDRYHEADSLLTAGLARAPQDLYLLGLGISVNQELDEYEDAIELARRAQAITGDENLSYTVITNLLALGRDDQARAEEERLALLASEVNAARLVFARVAGYAEALRLAEAGDALEIGKQHLDEDASLLLQSQIDALGHRWDAALEITQQLQDERPLDPGLNNNLAWYMACAGRDLERAEYLARMSMAVAGDDASASNTLAVVLLRQGRVDEARAMLTDLLVDDRPATRMANGYFLGLSYWLAGDREEALVRWRALVGPGERSEFGQLVRQTLSAIDAGEDPSWLYLQPAATAR